MDAVTDIAVIGASCRLPQAPDPEALWGCWATAGAGSAYSHRPPARTGALSPDQLDAMDEEPWRKCQYYGSEVHKETAKRLEQKYPGRFQYRTVGPDFVDNWNGKLVELTTPKAVKAHKKKGGDYLTCEYATYTWAK